MEQGRSFISERAGRGCRKRCSFLSDILVEFSGCGDAKTSREVGQSAALGGDRVIPAAAERALR